MLPGRGSGARNVTLSERDRRAGAEFVAEFVEPGDQLGHQLAPVGVADAAGDALRDIDDLLAPEHAELVVIEVKQLHCGLPGGGVIAGAKPPPVNRRMR